jgi:hypothetical protein
MRRILRKIIIFILFLLLVFCFYLFIGKAPQAEKIEWGVVFSQKHAQLLGLDWKKTYLEILDDLKVKNIKILTHWDLLEPENNNFYFDNLDWQIEEAQKRSAKLILVLGIKTGRWPECHIPKWVQKLPDREREKEVLEYLKIVIERYKQKESIWAWQIENEPFFPFGKCPKIEKTFVKKEIELVKSLDKRPIIFADSGEFSFWFTAARFGDIIGTTLHRKVYFKEIKRYISYPFPPVYYWRKAKIIEFLFGKKVINSELQAEPWCKSLIYNCPLKEQKITMDLEQFKKNLEFAKKTGFDKFYFWGVEWWYWLKEKGDNKIWQQAKNLFPVR